MEQNFKDWFAEVKSVALEHYFSENEVNNFMEKNWKHHYESEKSPREAIFAYITKTWDKLHK